MHRRRLRHCCLHLGHGLHRGWLHLWDLWDLLDLLDLLDHGLHRLHLHWNGGHQFLNHWLLHLLRHGWLHFWLGRMVCGLEDPLSHGLLHRLQHGLSRLDRHLLHRHLLHHWRGGLCAHLHWWLHRHLLHHWRGRLCAHWHRWHVLRHGLLRSAQGTLVRTFTWHRRSWTVGSHTKSSRFGVANRAGEVLLPARRRACRCSHDLSAADDATQFGGASWIPSKHIHVKVKAMVHGMLQH